MLLVGQKRELRNKSKNFLHHLEPLKKSKKLEIIHLFIMLKGIRPLQESDLKIFSEHFYGFFFEIFSFGIFLEKISNRGKAIEQMNGKEISPGETITCTIAKPSENNRNQNRRGRGKIFIFFARKF